MRRAGVLVRRIRNGSGNEPTEAEMMVGIGMDGPQTDGNNGVSGRFVLKKLENTWLRVSFSRLGCRNVSMVCTMCGYKTQMNLSVRNA